MIPNGSQEVARVRRARGILERMRGRLLRPTFDTLHSAADDLEVAVKCLRELDLSLQSPIWHGLTRRMIEDEVVALRREVHLVEALLKNAGHFYRSLARLLAPDEATPNYTAGGATGLSPQSIEKSVVLRG